MAANEARPLAGRRIAITRAREQAEAFARRLEESGAEVVFLPMVRFLDPEDTAALDRAIAALGEFGWLVFTSGNAVRFFLKRCRLLGQWPDPEDGPRIAAVGSATRAAVEAANLRAALVPEEFNAQALAAAMGSRASGKKVLLPRSDLANDELPVALRVAGADVTCVVAYRTAETEELDAAARRELAECDAVSFFSPSAFHNFKKSLGAAAPAENGPWALAAVGPVTAAALRAAGAEAIEASEVTGESLVAALELHFAANPGRSGTKGHDHVSH